MNINRFMNPVIKKTSVAGRVPNTFVLSADGDMALNTHDGKMFLSNSSVVFEVGANVAGNSNIGGSITSVDSITFDIQNPLASAPAGTLTWNPTEDCLDIFQGDGTVLQTGLEQYIRVRNSSESTLATGTLVMFAGVNGGNEPVVLPLVANSTFNPLYSVGVLAEDIESDEVGRATTFGKVRQIQTNGADVGETWQIGDLLWANEDYPGKLSNVKPTAPIPAISVAAVLKVGTTDGIILVRPTIQPRLFYGLFDSSVSQNCASSNTATPVTYNQTLLSSGHTLVTYGGVANSGIRAQFSGLYNYQFSLQVQSSSANRNNIWVWARKNGTDIPLSATKLSIESNGGVSVPAWNFLVSMDANDTFQLMWATDAFDKITLLAEASTAFCPQIPSVILSVTEVSQ